MMKKILALLLACVMVLSLAACGGNNGDNSGSGNGGGLLDNILGNSTKLSDKHVNESQKFEILPNEDEPITPNGELPNNEEDVEYYDVNYYFNEAFNAVIKLDEEGMKLYLDEEEYEGMMKIKNDPQAKALWEHTVGNVSYLPSARAVYLRPAHLTYSMWYMDQIKDNKKIPDSVGALSYDDLVEIYNEYYDKTPVCVTYCGGYEEFYIDDGYIKFEIGAPLILSGYSAFAELMDEDWYYDGKDNEYKFNHLYELVLSWPTGNDEWNDTEAILEDGEFKLFDAVMSKDVSAAEAIIDADPNAWESEWDSEDYVQYIKNAEAKAAFQKFLNERVTIYRSHEEVYFVVTVDTAVTYGDYDYDFKHDATDAERALLESAPYCNFDDMMCTENLGDQWKYTFGELLDYAHDYGVFKDIEFAE